MDDYIRSAKGSQSKLLINHFNYIEGICTKTGLLKSLTTYYQSLNFNCIQAVFYLIIFPIETKGYQVFHSMPICYVIVNGIKNDF